MIISLQFYTIWLPVAECKKRGHINIPLTLDAIHYFSVLLHPQQHIAVIQILLLREWIRFYVFFLYCYYKWRHKWWWTFVPMLIDHLYFSIIFINFCSLFNFITVLMLPVKWLKLLSRWIINIINQIEKSLQN